MSLPMFLAGFNNFIPATMETNAGEKVSSNQGLVSWGVDNTDKSVQNEFDYQDQSVYNPVSTTNYTYTIPIITISGSQVDDTGNTSHVSPNTISPSFGQTATATHSDSEESGVNLTEIIVPVAGIAGVAALAYALLGGKK